MSNKVAIIDMGTNTFHLLLAESTAKGKYEIIFRDRTAVRIGKGGINNAHITNEGMERAVLAMQEFKAIIDQNKIGNIKAFGTSALRSAVNSNEVLTRIQSATGIEVKIISGDTEAEYIYWGVRSGVEMGSRKTLVMDIGGGSVEFIIANNEQIFWKKSLEIGAQRLLEKFHNHDPITVNEIGMLNDYFAENLSPLFEALKVNPAETLIGASGAFDTLSDIYCSQESIAKGDNDAETPLTLAAFHRISEEIILKNRKDRMAIGGMIEMRVDMIVVTCCLIKYILSRYRFDEIRVSSYSLKEGVLASLTQTMYTSDFAWSK
jgi:exopolyphosphatase/guanosine-5'-triphosphate,3'-diphosphate pyrophosphatase